MAPPSFSAPGWSLDRRNPNTIRAWMPVWAWVHRHYFQVQSQGWEHVPGDRPVLFVGSHNGGLASPDMIMCMFEWFHRFGAEHPCYGLMHPKVWQIAPPLGQLAEECGAIQAHPKMAMRALQRGASVLVYPGGGRDVFRPYRLRHKICLYDNNAFIKLALREGVEIIPVVSTGAHETLIVLEDFYPWAKRLHEQGLLPWIMGVDPEVFPLYLGLPWGLGIGPMFNIPWPKPIRLRLGQAIAFDHKGKEAARDRDYVQQCYHQVEQTMQQLLDELVAESSASKPSCE